MDRKWRDRAACRPGSGVDPELFFPACNHDKPDSEQPAKVRAQIAAAKAVCAGCPVTAECLASAQSASAGYYTYGVCGGLSADERRKLARRKPRAGKARANAANG